MERNQILSQNKHSRRTRTPLPSSSTHHDDPVTHPINSARPFAFCSPPPLDHSSRPAPNPSISVHHHHHHHFLHNKRWQKSPKASQWQKNRAVTTRTFVLPGDSQENPPGCAERAHTWDLIGGFCFYRPTWERGRYLAIYPCLIGERIR